MATQKQSTIPAPAVEKLQFKISLVGNATATFWRPAELSPRRARELQVLFSYMQPKLAALSRAQQITVDGTVAATSDTLGGIPVGLTLEEMATMFRLNDLAGWTFLKSWTLKENGEPRPLPASADDLQDLPPAIYQKIIEHGAKIMFSEDDGGFSVGSTEDYDSPTTA
jgi:hypothetical protein